MCIATKTRGLVDEQGATVASAGEGPSVPPGASFVLTRGAARSKSIVPLSRESPPCYSSIWLSATVGFRDWFVGDISNAFLQGSSLQGKEDMFMRPPRQGLKGVKQNQLLKLLKPVYGRPDAPRAWYEELARVLTEELTFSKSCIDPAVFMLRNNQGLLIGCMIVHVDDLMVCHDGSEYAKQVVEKLRKRFPFGTWDRVMDKPNGVTYCGKEISS